MGGGVEGRCLPTGAMKVPLCFSAASMKMVKTSWAVKNISMNKPCATVVPPPSVVCTFSLPGNMQLTSAAAVKPPKICATNSSAPLIHGSAPIRHMPKVTAGLNRPPLILKKTQAFTAREKPKHNEMYCSC